MALELDPEWPITSIQGYDAGSCIAGTRYARITPNGEVTACPYIEASVGSVRKESFSNLWRSAPMFQSLRAPKLGGRCGVWKNRHAVCATWFCKHERGAFGSRAWRALQGLFQSLEDELALWCVNELDVGPRALWHSAPEPRWSARVSSSRLEPDWPWAP